MCYDIKSSLQSQLKRAKHYGNKEAIKEIEEKLAPQTSLPLFHAQGHSHPRLLIYRNTEPFFPTVATWGLIPSWANKEDVPKLAKMTLNARGESIFEKSSFKNSAKNKRCLVYIDGFYEHHHYNKKTYPFYIYRNDGEPMVLGGLWNEWIDGETGEILTTFSIVTTEGNELLAKIHNNPKLVGPRMPLILSEESTEQWLIDFKTPEDQKFIQTLIKPHSIEGLAYHTVNRLRGKDYIGNISEISEKVVYEELVF